MHELQPDDLGPQLRKWAHERPSEAKYPRIPSNPYGDNALGLAYDEGWWAALAFMKRVREGRS